MFSSILLLLMSINRSFRSGIFAFRPFALRKYWRCCLPKVACSTLKCFKDFWSLYKDSVLCYWVTRVSISPTKNMEL